MASSDSRRGDPLRLTVHASNQAPREGVVRRFPDPRDRLPPYRVTAGASGRRKGREERLTDTDGPVPNHAPIVQSLLHGSFGKPLLRGHSVRDRP
jgi:hypothetical protein